jgi:hypothetical protein
MNGRFITIRANGAVETEDFTDMPDLEKFQRAVGGHLEVVPNFKTFDGENCVVMCDEEGKVKDKPINYPATHHWYEAARTLIPDVLVGDILVITGDDEFMENL